MTCPTLMNFSTLTPLFFPPLFFPLFPSLGTFPVHPLRPIFPPEFCLLHIKKFCGSQVRSTGEFSVGTFTCSRFCYSRLDIELYDKSSASRWLSTNFISSFPAHLVTCYMLTAPYLHT